MFRRYGWCVSTRVGAEVALVPNEQHELFASVDALLEQAAAQCDLPEPAERKRLREAAGLSQDQVARALSVRRETITGWESGRTEPRAPKRAAYARLLDGLAARHPDPADRTSPEPASATAQEATLPHGAAPREAPSARPAPSEAPPAVPPTVPRTPARPTASRGPAGRQQPRDPAGRRQPPAPDAAPPSTPLDPRFAHGPLAVLDGEGAAYCVGGLVLDCPAKDIVALTEWALKEAKLGAPRLNRHGKDADPLLVITEAAAGRLGLPAVLEDRRNLRLPDDHKISRQIAKAKWKLTKRGFGPWTRVYRPAQAGRRQCVQFAILPWGALDARSWGGAAQLGAAELASVLGAYAMRVLTPRGSTAVSGLELMTSLRPPTRAVKDEAGEGWVSGPNPGSLTEPMDPAPPEAPSEHPVVASVHPRGHQRSPDEVLDEEAFEWIRDPQLLTDDECARKYAVGIDVNTAFLAAANRLTVGLGAPVHVKAPAFDKAMPGSWLIDLSGIELDPRLPNPFTPHGERPTGPAWYATPTVSYAAELIATYGLPVSLAPLEAWVRPENGPYLDPWYKQLSEAYKSTMADLGITPGMTEADFLAAMATHRQTDPGMAVVLSAIKSTVKGGIGKLRERPQGATYTYGERWPALERPTWRPDIRAAVIAAARANMHRKILKTALATQHSTAPTGHLNLEAEALIPVALLSDCAVYLADGPGPLDFLPHTPDGKPAPGSFRLGVSPGMVKHEGTQDLLWAVQMLDEGHNPARHIKGTDAAEGGE